MVTHSHLHSRTWLWAILGRGQDGPNAPIKITPLPQWTHKKWLIFSGSLSPSLPQREANGFFFSLCLSRHHGKPVFTWRWSRASIPHLKRDVARWLRTDCTMWCWPVGGPLPQHSSTWPARRRSGDPWGRPLWATRAALRGMRKWKLKFVITKGLCVRKERFRKVEDQRGWKKFAEKILNENFV